MVVRRYSLKSTQYLQELLTDALEDVRLDLYSLASMMADVKPIVEELEDRKEDNV